MRNLHEQSLKCFTSINVYVQVNVFIFELTLFKWYIQMFCTTEHTVSVTMRKSIEQQTVIYLY